MINSFYDEIRSNKIKSIALLVLVTLFLSLIIFWIASLFSAQTATILLIVSLIISIITTWSAYYYSDLIVIKSVNAKPLSRTKWRRVHELLEGLSIGAGLPKPRLFVMNNSDINAMATGRDPEHAAIIITTGALKNLNRDELEGVLAHELSHIKNFDVRFITTVAVIIGIGLMISGIVRNIRFMPRDNDDKGFTILFIITWLIIGLITPIILLMIKAAVSRRREFLADASAVELTRNPDGLINALKKISLINNYRLSVNNAVSPLLISEKQSLFSTHPPISERIKRLESMM